MPRPRKWRMVQSRPTITLFKPQGVPLWHLKEVVLPVEGLEALRLADVEGLDQETAAARMGVSRPTFSRVLTAARETVARGLTEGMAIRVEGGNFMVDPGFEMGPGGGRRRGRGGHGHGGWGPGRGGPG